MRRTARFLALLVACLALAGCGGDDDQPPVTPLGDALGYFDRDARLVVAVETNPEGDQVKRASELAGQFPAGTLVAGRVRDLARFRFVRFERDLRPLLRHPLVIGIVGRPARRRNAEPPVVAALRVPNPRRAKQFVLRQPGFIASGKTRGVRIYGNPTESRWTAVDGDVLLVSSDRDAMVRALGTRRGDEHMTEAAFGGDLVGLPKGALARVSADPRALIGDDPRLRTALNVKWVGALRRIGATLKLVDSGVLFDLRANTNAGELDDDDLPLAPKPGPIPLVGGRADVKAGVREPARLVRFVSDLWNRAAPKRAERVRRAAAGRIDWTRVVRHLGDVGVVAVNPFTRAFAGRVAVIEPADVRDGLAGIAPALLDVAPLFGWGRAGIATPEPGESFYALATRSGKTVVFGVVGSSLVAASEAGRAAGLASEQTQEVRGDPAAAVLTLDAREVVGQAIARMLGGGPAALAAPLAVAPLRDLTGRAIIDQKRLRASVKLTVVR